MKPGYLPVRALALTLILGACSGNTPDLGPGKVAAPPAGVSAEDTSAGAAYADAATAAKSGDSSFNPFADPSQPAPGGREVIAEPSLADVMQTGSLPEMAMGRPDAPLTLIQYASLTCPHCRHFHETTFPQMKRELIDSGKLRYILREFPIGKQSGNATVALRCAPPEKYFDLYGKFMTQQGAWVSQEVRLDPIFAVAQQVGMKREQFDACLENQGMIDALKWVKERGRKLGVVGTPNYFANGKLVKRELTIEELRAMAAEAGSGRGVAAAQRP